jgi:hypothetical protein
MGIVYLVQPGICRNTNHYKVGASTRSNVSRIHNGYDKDVKTICVWGTNEPYELETLIIKKFREEFTTLSGREWFVGDVDKMKRVFIDIVFAYEGEGDNDTTTITEEDVRIVPPEDISVFVPSLKKFELNPNTNMYEKRVIRGERSYVVSIHPTDWNNSTRRSILHWLKKHDVLTSSFTFGNIKEDPSVSIYDIINNGCEFCGRKCSSLQIKRRHMKSCRYSKIPPE